MCNIFLYTLVIRHIAALKPLHTLFSRLLPCHHLQAANTLDVYGWLHMWTTKPLVLGGNALNVFTYIPPGLLTVALRPSLEVRKAVQVQRGLP